MRKMLRRAASVLLAFSIVMTMGMPVQAQTETGISVQTVASEESESTVSEEVQPAEDQTVSDGEETPEGSAGSREETPDEDHRKPEDESTLEDMAGSDDETVSKGETESEGETVSENTTPPEEETISENTLPSEVSARDTEGALAFNPDSKYAMVAQSSGLAVNATAKGWGSHIRVGAAYYRDSNKILDEKAQFVITPADSADIANEAIIAGDGEVKVRIESLIDGDKYPFRVETPNNYAFADADKRYDKEQEIYLIKKTDEDQGTLQAASNGRYATIEDGELRFKEGTTEDQAEKFLFAENPGILDTTIRIEHKASGKYIKTYRENGTPLTVDGNADEEGVAFSKAVFDSNDTDTIDGLTFVTVSLVSEDYGNGVGSVFWDDGQKAEEVKSHGRVDGNGWETIRILGNGDGTVSFKDSCYDQYITVKDGKLMCGQLPRETEREELTDQEKFILYTEITPLPAEDLSFDESSRTQSTIDLLWKNPLSLFTGIEVWQKKASEDDEAYRKVGEAGSEEKYTATGLEKDTEYSFK
ncbi:MAG: fibronectin type III domain-containing protein, partial [Lachnospiraceae bacterium]|nr:fibronectin type III domain-containing protein [Lachnospiraceae bacterium]